MGSQRQTVAPAQHAVSSTPTSSSAASTQGPACSTHMLDPHPPFHHPHPYRCVNANTDRMTAAQRERGTRGATEQGRGCNMAPHIPTRHLGDARPRRHHAPSTETAPRQLDIRNQGVTRTSPAPDIHPHHHVSSDTGRHTRTRHGQGGELAAQRRPTNEMQTGRATEVRPHEPPCPLNAMSQPNAQHHAPAPQRSLNATYPSSCT
jgi:hypothetical protein